MQNTLMITGLILTALAIMFFRTHARMKNIPLVSDHEKILTLTDKNFQHQTRNKTVLVDFWASWCAPCRIMAPILNDVADELSSNTHVGKVNIEHHQSLANQYKVRNIPTLLLLKNSIEINRFVGLKSKDFLLHQINKA
jgi:thioredoxin 1